MAVAAVAVAVAVAVRVPPRRAAPRERQSFGPAYTDLIRGRDGRYPVSWTLRSEQSRASKVETRLRALSRSSSISVHSVPHLSSPPAFSSSTTL